MIDVQMPQLGESVAEGTVTQWHVKPGDYVKREQPLLEVATDKADSEVPSPSDGIVVELAAEEGDIVAAGGLLCKIDETAKPEDAGDGEDREAAEEEAPRGERRETADRVTAGDGAGDRRQLTSPSTRRLAREEGVNLGEIRGTGVRGRITRDDVERAASGAGAMTPPPPSLPAAPPSMMGYEPVPSQARAPARAPAAEDLRKILAEMVPVPGQGYGAYKVPAFKQKEGDEVVPFNRRRRITADHMVYSQHVSPHVVTVAEIDLHATSALRDRHKGAFKKEGIPLTFLAFIVAAVVKALREYPVLNARVLDEDDSYVKIKDINVGVAVDTPSGLLVASIKNTDRLSMSGIAASIDELATRARSGKITADDLMGTTFTVSNPGRKGNLFGGAIISQPNVGILRVGEIKKRPVVVERDGEDVLAIHPVMFAALSYDHRIVDGVEANAFLWRISEVLEKAEFEI